MTNHQVTVPNRREPPADEPTPSTGALERARWEVAALAGRLRTVEYELAERTVQETAEGLPMSALLPGFGARQK